MSSFYWIGEQNGIRYLHGFGDGAFARYVRSGLATGETLMLASRFLVAMDYIENQGVPVVPKHAMFYTETLIHSMFTGLLWDAAQDGGYVSQSADSCVHDMAWRLYYHKRWDVACKVADILASSREE